MNSFLNHISRDLVAPSLLVEVQELVGDLLEVFVDGDELVVDVEQLVLDDGGVGRQQEFVAHFHVVLSWW